MKITPEHYAHMRAAMAAKLATDPTAPARYREAGLTERRFSWDLFHAAGLTPWACSNVYSYANDTHIATALRAIMRDLLKS